MPPGKPKKPAAFSPWTLRLSQRPIRSVGNRDRAIREEVGRQVFKRLFSVCAACITEEQLLAIDRNVLNDSFVAVIRQRGRIDLGFTVALKKERFMFGPGPAADAGAD